MVYRPRNTATSIRDVNSNLSLFYRVIPYLDYMPIDYINNCSCPYYLI